MSVPFLPQEFYVSPNGRSAAEGSKLSPWDLPSVLAGAKAVKPGDTVWLCAGTYKGRFTSRLAGTKDAPITVRALPGERATFDTSELFMVNGPWTVWWGFEVMCSAPKRKTAIRGSWPKDIKRGGMFSRASHVKFVNLIVHDTAQGFGFWSGGEGGEIYGCIIYNNGWIGPDRGHGHAIYTQNKTGTKRLLDNIMFNQFSYGIHAYGSTKAFLSNLRVEGNVSFNNGSPASPDGRTPAILVGGGCAAEGVTVTDNYTYGDGKRGGGGVRLGYSWGRKHNRDAVVRGNYFAGPVAVLFWERVTFEGNTVIAPAGLVHLLLPKAGSAKRYRWDRNAYFRTGTKWEAFGLAPPGGKLRGCGFAEWRKQGLDAGSSYAQTKPAGVKVFVRPNRYERGRAHVIVYNWDRKQSVSVDLGGVLKRGRKYRIVSAQDFFGEPILRGVQDGKPVALPMSEYRSAPPIGMPKHVPPATGPEFNVFVVLPGG